MKTCSKCKVEKPYDMFTKNRTTSDGYFYWCKECARAYGKARYAANPEPRKEYAARWAEQNPEKRAEYGRKASRNFYTNHPDRVHESQKKWKAANPDLVASQDRRRKLARKRKIDAAMTSWDSDLDTLVQQEADNLRLLRIRLTGIDWQVDHVVPLKAKNVSGLHNAYNLSVVPGRYNASKRNRFDESMLTNREWL